MTATPPATLVHSKDWHAIDLPTLLLETESTERGIIEAEAKLRLERFGPNELPHQPPPSWWNILLRQFRSPLIYILAIAATVSVAVGDVTDAVFIALVLGINALIGGIQEW